MPYNGGILLRVLRMRSSGCSASPRRFSRVRVALLVAAALGGAPGLPAAPPVASSYLEELTWVELRERIEKGNTTILVPIGGTEQNGPHMVLGKHNVRARILAGRISARLGNALVAPVIAYVPEGSIHPPAGHMRFPGTISVSETAFESVLESAARSFKQHGFRDVVFLGDHGGYQSNEEHVAARLNREWAADPSCRVHGLTQYYRAIQEGFAEDLKRRGFSAEQVGTHAGLADTALALAVDPALVRAHALAGGTKPTERDGVSGDPTLATAALGQLGLDRIVQASVDAIREAIRRR